MTAEIPKVTMPDKSSRPRVFIFEPNSLRTIKQRIFDRDETVAAEIGQLQRAARRSLAAGAFSVVTKLGAPPSGDKHDYMSQAPYYWRNRITANGLPYIWRDGQRNPEINKFPDHRIMDEMVSAVETLALAYYFTEDETYAAGAARLLRAWFLDAATRMNPNLLYAQAIPGLIAGRGIGLIETRGLTRVVDSLGLLIDSQAWTDRDQQSIEAWFAAFLDWMVHSKNGRDEAAEENNHGTYFDVQAASYALIAGRRDLASEILKSAGDERIAVQIEPDGRQPRELARTKAWSYSVANLDGLMLLARLAENVQIDLWCYRTPDGRGIRAALEYLIQFAIGERKWPYQQLGLWQPEILFPLMRRAARRYTDERFTALTGGDVWKQTTTMRTLNDLSFFMQ